MGEERIKMRSKKLLAGILLGVSLCFIPVLGYGEISQDIVEGKVSLIDFYLLQTKVSYIMWNPTNSLYIDFYYDADGRVGRNLKFPESVDTRGKICIDIIERADISSYEKSGDLLDIFPLKLIIIYQFIKNTKYSLTTDMNTDIVAVYRDRADIPLAYFYQGEYHLWEK